MRSMRNAFNNINKEATLNKDIELFKFKSQVKALRKMNLEVTDNIKKIYKLHFGATISSNVEGTDSVVPPYEQFILDVFINDTQLIISDLLSLVDTFPKEIISLIETDTNFTNIGYNKTKTDPYTNVIYPAKLIARNTDREFFIRPTIDEKDKLYNFFSNYYIKESDALNIHNFNVNKKRILDVLDVLISIHMGGRSNYKGPLFEEDKNRFKRCNRELSSYTVTEGICSRGYNVIHKLPSVDSPVDNDTVEYFVGIRYC